MADMTNLAVPDGVLGTSDRAFTMPAARHAPESGHEASAVPRPEAGTELGAVVTSEEPMKRLRAFLHRLHSWREEVRRRPKQHRIYKATVGIIGGAIVVGGLALVPLPGPGWVIVFVGLAILASEFERADRVQQFARSKVRAWTAWLNRQPVLVRLAVGLLTFAFVACVVYGLAVLSGVPSWVPDWAVPPLPGLD
jgi:uncharacterized protein (TIGR02611 family)